MTTEKMNETPENMDDLHEVASTFGGNMYSMFHDIAGDICADDDFAHAPDATVAAAMGYAIANQYKRCSDVSPEAAAKFRLQITGFMDMLANAGTINADDKPGLILPGLVQ